MTSVQTGLVTRSPQRLAANPARVIARLFVPGKRASIITNPERERCSRESWHWTKIRYGRR
jgi:hypothetical protein